MTSTLTEIIKTMFFLALCIACMSLIGCSPKPQPKIHVMREPAFPDNVTEKTEVDVLHRDIHDSTKWGQAETKPWNERYIGEESNLPYQGSVGD
ncbi:MAG: hypothetical protein IT292_09045 [Deltaproteobacteria bacterium]|nr:hypothetical protein [Deltaproteobacteria bacterium]